MKIWIEKAKAEIDRRKREEESAKKQTEATLRIMDLLADDLEERLRSLAAEAHWPEVERFSVYKDDPPYIQLRINMRMRSLSVEVRCDKEGSGHNKHYANPFIAVGRGGWTTIGDRFSSAEELFTTPLFEEHIISLIITNHEKSI